LNFECYFSSENEKHDTQNLCGGMMAVGDELRDGSRALRARRRHGTNRRRVWCWHRKMTVPSAGECVRIRK